MIKSITLKNFRKHRDAAFGFGPGLTTLRGSNEQGKSTVVEAVAYALFGVKAIRSSLSDAVTWGEAESSLKVTLVIDIEGTEYTVTRGKSGAEVNYGGGIVTGQTEVTNFTAGRLKVDPSSATKLMFSAQLDVRGALEAGPKATTELIEKLAGFDQIDSLIELMQEKLTLGNTAGALAAVAAAQDEMTRARTLAVPVDEIGHKRRIDAARSAYNAALSNVSTCEIVERTAAETLARLREGSVHRDGLVRDYRRAKYAAQTASEALDSIVLPDEPISVDAKVGALQQRIADEENAMAIRETFAKVKFGLKPFEGKPYPGTLDDLKLLLQDGAKRAQEAKDAVLTLTGDLKLLNAQLTHGTCTFCGKDFSGVPEVAARNAVTEEAISRTETEIAAARKDGSRYAEQVALMSVIERHEREAQALIHVGGAFVEVTSKGSLPTQFKWVGPVVAELGSGDTRALRKEIKALQESVTAFALAKSRRGDAGRALGEADAVLVAATVALEACQEIDTSAAQFAVDEARVRTQSARASLAEAHKDLSAHERSLEDALSNYKRAAADVKGATERHACALKSVAELEFNNALLKRVRAARPLISDKLWSIVLQAVSSYFSEIRGFKSRVTKESDGFQVDRHPITSMSGSTLDALGLAIRVALVRTFLPASPFLVLDEPSAAMDDDRTGNMLGFLSTCGFKQVLLITHEALSETVADNVITLEG